MTSELKDMLSRVDTLSEEDLKALQKHISDKLEGKESSSSLDETPEDKASDNGAKSVELSKIGYVMSSQELKKLLFSFLTPEEWAELDNNEIVGELPTLPRPIQEYIAEDREDRI
jgi:hypothetical protein